MYKLITLLNDFLSGKRKYKRQVELQSEITITNKTLRYAYNIGNQGRN